MARILGQLPKAATGTTPAPSTSTGSARVLGKVGRMPLSYYQQQGTIAKAAADKANTPSSIALQTAKNTLGSIAGGALKFVRSGLEAPYDIQNAIQGKAPVDTSGQRMGGTYQEDVANKIIPAVTSGTMSPIQGTISAVGNTLSGAADTLGVTGLAEKGASLAGNAIGKISDAAKAILPEAKTAGEKALSLTEKELSAVDKSKLKYLTDKGFDMAKTEGGILKEKAYKMTAQVKSLAKEFGNVLTGKTPEENIQNVQKELGRLQQVSKQAFEGANKAINQNSLVTGIKDSIEKMSDSVYESMSKENKTAFSDKRINDFLSYVKEGTLKGLDDALESFRAANAKSDATISKATDATYQAVKKYIVDNLPADKAAIYKAANQSQAKLFDVAEILKGKLQASIGTLNKAGKALKYAAIGTGGIIGERLLKQVPGLGNFIP